MPVSGTAPLCAGKCHASVLVGRRLLFFAGSMYTCSELAWLDLEQLAWGRCGLHRCRRRLRLLRARGGRLGPRAAGPLSGGIHPVLATPAGRAAWQVDPRTSACRRRRCSAATAKCWCLGGEAAARRACPAASGASAASVAIRSFTVLYGATPSREQAVQRVAVRRKWVLREIARCCWLTGAAIPRCTCRYTFAYREVADLHVLDLQPAKCELKRLLRGERLPGGRPADGRRSWRGFWR